MLLAGTDQLTAQKEEDEILQRLHTDNVKLKSGDLLVPGRDGIHAHVLDSLTFSCLAMNIIFCPLFFWQLLQHFSSLFSLSLETDEELRTKALSSARHALRRHDEQLKDFRPTSHAQAHCMYGK